MPNNLFSRLPLRSNGLCPTVDTIPANHLQGNNNSAPQSPNNLGHISRLREGFFSRKALHQEFHYEFAFIPNSQG